MPGGLLTDLYELNMAVSYLRRGMTGPATFSLFVRRLPPDRGFLSAAGLEDCLRSELPRVFRTGNLRLIHAASCPFRYSSRTSCGVRYPSVE